jgi:carbon monoxide dehydrogenase subunit G
VQFLELDRPKHAAVLARGQAPGSAVEMVSNMDLSEFDETHTVMEWSSDVTVSGMIQQVGARLMQGAADKITQQVFACIKAKLEAPVPI